MRHYLFYFIFRDGNKLL